LGSTVNARILAALLLSASLAACAAGSGTNAQAAANAVTKAVYADDFDAVTANFDDSLKSRISRTEVGALSDKLHSLGSFRGSSYVKGDPAKNEFTYRLSFDQGSISAVVRLDSSGKLAAYRLFPS
jgi:hypothetical protein